MADFKEEDHDRDEKGRFTAGALSLAAAQWSKSKTSRSEAFGAGKGNGYGESVAPPGTFARLRFGKNKETTNRDSKGELGGFRGPPKPEEVWRTRGSHWGRGGRTVKEEVPLKRGEATAGKMPEKKAGQLPDKTKGEVGDLGKQPRFKSEAAKAKMAETREVTKTIGQKDAPIDLFDLAASHFEPAFKKPSYGRGSWEKDKARNEDIAVQSRALIGQTTATYLLGQHGAKPFEGESRGGGGLIGRYDPSNNREVFHIGTYDIDRPDELAKLNLKNPPKEEGWYYTDSRDHDQLERVPDRSETNKPYSDLSFTRSSGFGAESAARTESESKARAYKDLSNDYTRFPYGLHPAIANEQFPGSKQTFKEHFDKVLNPKGDMRGGSTRSEYQGIDTHLSQDALKNIDKVGLKLWQKLEPQIRKDMAADGGMNRFWTDEHLKEGSGGPKYGGFVLGMQTPTEKKMGWDPVTGNPKVETKPLAEMLRDWAKTDVGEAHIQKTLPGRKWDHDAWAGKKDAWTEDPKTKADFANADDWKKYVEVAKAKKKQESA